jgi:spore coat polysaccharide biosynthesis protein SpsF
MQYKIVTVIQARNGSSRLPGKVLLPLASSSLLVRMVERVKRSQLCGTVVVATTSKTEDDAIQSVCDANGILCFRGDPIDLLDRHYQVAKNYRADVVLKIPSDCPLIDPHIIDQVIAKFIEDPDKYDFVSNLHPATFPDGNDVEVMSFTALEAAWQYASSLIDREHTTPYIWDNPEVFKIENVCWEAGLNYSASHRWTIDYPEDYEFIKSVYEILYPINPEFGIKDILDLLEKRPDIYHLNSCHAGQYWYLKHLNELKTIKANP